MSRTGMVTVCGAAQGAPNAGLFGNGSDGALTVAENQTVALDVQEDVGQIVKQYTTLTIEAGGVLKPAHRCNGMIIMVQGDCTIRGTLSVSKCGPLLNDQESTALEDIHIKLMGALMGGDGGDGGDCGTTYDITTTEGDVTTTVKTPYKKGGKGGKGHLLGGGFGGGGAGDGLISGDNGGDSEPRPPHGITFPPETSGQYGAGGNGRYSDEDYSHGKGGKGPGGSGGTNYYATVIEGHPSGAIDGVAGDAYPGGGLWLYVGGTLRIETNGQVVADGGNGANVNTAKFDGSGGFPGQGGSAGGGIIAIVYGGKYENLGSVHANGGTTPALTSHYDTNRVRCKGQNGSVGTVKVVSVTTLTLEV